MTQGAPLVLASVSPRRAELMRGAGWRFEALPVDVEEEHDAALSPAELTVANALRKARAGALLRPDAIVIGADTLVYLDGEPLGKPADLAAAAVMLRRLSGREHEVCTGVALALPDGRARTFAEISKVRFKSLTDESIAAYHRLINPLDKAGAYAVQEHGERVIQRTEGSWSNIVGLPLERLARELRELGCEPG